MAAWIKMPLGTEVGLRVRLRDIVLDGDPAPGLGMQVGLGHGHTVLDRDPTPLPKKVAERATQIFDPCLL